MENKKNNRLKVRFCQNCGSAMDRPESIIIEYWAGDQIISFCWCHHCGWKGEVTDTVNFRITEPEEDE